MRLIFYITLIFTQALCGQTQVLTDPLSISSRSITFYESLGQSVIGNTTSSGVTLLEGIGYLLVTSAPSVTLNDTDSDNIVSNSDVVTITATFSESMTATPTLSLTGIVSDAEMTATASASIWTYTWTVSTTVTSTTATVSGTNLVGNAYAGTDSLTFSIDNLGPTVVLSNNSLNNRVSNTQSVTLYATFSEELDITPTISLSGITTDAAMSNGNTIVLKPNNGWTSSSGSFQDFNGSSGSHPYLAEDLVIFSYLDNASIYKNFTISSGTVSVVVKLDYKKSYSEDTGQVKLYYYDANSTLLSTDASAVLTGTSDFQNLNFQSSVPSGAVVVRLELIQINESEFWAGNYGIRYRDLEITGVDEGTVYGGNDTWSYTWTVSTTATSTTATVSATDNAGNSYTGSESMTFVIDNERPYAVSMTLSNNLKAGYISATDTNTLTITFNEEINASTFTASDVTILPSGYFSISEHTSSYNTIFIGYLNVLSNYAGVVTLTLNENSLEDLAGNANTVSSVSFISDYTVPTVTLTDTDSDNLVSNSEVVTLTATFSESMSATPTLSLTGIVSDAEMTATASDSIWTYTWTVSGSTVTSTTATVSGTDLAGNAYSGTDSITFTIDNSNPTLVSFTDSDTDNYVNDYTNVTLSATFSESMASSPTIKIDNGTNVILVNSASMTVSSSTSSATWTYFWDVPGGSDGTYFATVSGTDLSGNAYTGTESITFVVDNTAPLIQSVTVTNTNSKVLLTYNEPVQLYDPSYFASNFSVTKTGGTATVSYTGYSFSTTDSNTIILNITVTGEPTGDELLTVGPAGASTLIDRAGNYALAYSDSSQTSNTVYLTNTPPKFTSTTVNSNNTSITIVFSEGVTADASGTELSKTDFTLAVSGGTAVLASATPSALSKTDSKTYVLTTSYTTPPNGSEILTVTPISSTVFDSKGTQIVLSTLSSNTVQLNDQAGPSITGATLDSQNRYVDITFSEGVYATASPTSAVTSSSFTISQSSGPSYGMTISSITTAGGGVLSGGETTLRFNLGSTVKPTGQEVFAITATDSSSVVDVSGNSMTVSQTNNTFQLKPPTSGGVSPEKSTISAAPAEMIANGINTAVITVQAKDSLGQNFLEGGYQITLFGPAGDLTTTDNQNGTYSASYTPDAITQDFEELTFGFRVASTNGTNTALLRLYLDEDGDGVYNINDACLGTETGLEVDATGCALNQLDSDNDGIFDDLDECPDTPEFEINNVKGTPTYGELIPTIVDEKGCGASQRDTDGDGIVDTEDNCIETANTDQADADGDDIGDVCDTDNPLPEITTTEIKFVQLPQNGTTVGKIEATDPDGETLTFAQAGDNFTGVLSVASDGSVTVSSGALLTFDSAYNGASLGFTVSDGENDVPGSVKILIEDAPRPPEISIITLEISEDAEVGTIVGFVEVRDPMGGQIVSVDLEGDGFIELEDGVLKTTQELDYETNTSHAFIITAQASDRSDGPGLIGSKSESIRVADIPNATYTGRFFISIFNVEDETLGAKVDHTRYFNPHNKNVGKWKIRKKIKGGADADKFTIRTRIKDEVERKNGDPVAEQTEDYLDFIDPPDFENPGDANKDNIYEVEIEYLNTDDGAPEVPIVVTQTNIQVPEGKSRTIELQAQPVLPTDDNDGDGIVDILDNSPLVSNPDQSDEDGDGVGDVTDDSDHDGVWNPFDTCPDTPLGELVDLDGCLIYYLPPSNFSISKTEKCIGENSITINVIDATVDYNVTVSGATNAAEVFTGSSWSLENLSAGKYNLCIGVEGVNPLEFERCFEVTIEESDPLLVSSLYNKENQTVSFDLSGGSAYQITHNGKTTQTSSSKHTVQLDKGINNISISTGIECQGLFQNSYLNSYEVKYAPNPFKEQLQLFIGGKDNLVEIGVYASNGQLIDYQTVSLSFGMRNYSLNTSSYKQGVYIIKVKGETLDQSIQVIKE
ncbi:thrombospondin type 3 repeat-containing protein [Flavobacteriaceae bacterium]|nr:thrombospondin type 3 repeat-containing protein [Flavobacteriaceae bacterium]